MDAKSAINKMKTKPVRCVDEKGVGGWAAPGGMCHVGFNAKQKAGDDASRVRMEGKEELRVIEERRRAEAERQAAKRNNAERGQK